MEEKYNVFEKQENLEIRNAQIVYLAEECGMTANQIQKYVDLAISTIHNYIRKFSYLLEKAKQWFGTKAKQVVDKIKEKCNVTDIVTYNCEHHKGDCAYIIEYFDSQHNFVFLKVGMTNNIDRRIPEHLRYYTNKGYDTTYAVVKELHFAEDEEDALTLENCLRKHYKKNKNNGFLPRDRFEMVRYNEQKLQADVTLQKQLQMFSIA